MALKKTQITEKALRESEASYRTIFNAANDSIFVHHLETGAILDVNETMCETFGYSKEEVLKLDVEAISEGKPPFSQKEAIRWIHDAAEGRPQLFEWRCRKKSGELFWVEVNLKRVRIGNDDRMLAIVRDISDRKNAESALHASEERFRALIESGTNLVAILGRNGKFHYVSPSAQSLFGYETSEILGKSPRDFMHADDIYACEKTMRDAVSRPGKTLAMNVCRCRHKDGSWLWVEGAMICLYDQPGVDGIVFSARDVTETRRLQEFASRAQRLETAGRIAGQVAHDFNNLLGPLVAYPDFIKEGLPDSHPLLQYVQDMKDAAEQMSEINQQLLTLGRRGHYSLEPLDLNGVVTRALSQIRPVPETLLIEQELADDLMTVKGGGCQIFRAITNLISNARDAMQDIGVLTIKTENYYNDDSKGSLADIGRGEYVKLTITDTGTGIPSEAYPKIFDPFFTTKIADRKRGSGLGLSVVHAVVEDHDGYIDCKTSIGEGTSFFVYFPTTRENAEMGEVDSLAGRGENILVVDDDRMQRDVCRNLLEKLGYRTTLCESGEEALKLMKRGSYDLLVVDMIMPNGIDGTETMKRALEINDAQKAIVVSGYAESERVREALRLGASEFIRKPLSLKSISHAVRRALDSRQVTREEKPRSKTPVS